MGGKESKQFPITYEEAAKRVSDGERRRLQDAFRRLVSSSPSGLLSRAAFVRDVLGDAIPPTIAEQMFLLCCASSGGSAGRGLAFKDALALLVLITRGTREEKIKFIYGLLASDDGKYVEKSEMFRLVSEWEGGGGGRAANGDGGGPAAATHANATHSISEPVRSLFSSGERVGFDVVSAWLEQNPGALPLSRWLLAADAGAATAKLCLTNKLDTPTFYQTLAGVTHLEEQEIVELEKRFWTLVGASTSGQIDASVVRPLVSPPLPPECVHGFFAAFDENQDGHIDFKELSCGVSAACRGPELERQKFCFKMFDTDRDGMLSRSELTTMIACMVAVSKQTQPAAQDETPARAPDVGRMVDSILGEKPALSAEDFLVWTVANVYPADFARLLFQLCHVALGLHPRTRREEGEIVRGWLEREERAALVPGHVWYLLNMEWWTGWHAYVNAAAASDAANAAQTHENAGASGASSDGARPDHSPSSHQRAVAAAAARKKPAPVDAALAADGDGSGAVVGTKYMQLSEYCGLSSLSVSHQRTPSDSASVGSAGSRQSSRLGTPSGSPFASRKGSNLSLNAATSSASAAAAAATQPPRPGLIDNTCLVQPPARDKLVMSLTGEGGKLKTHIRLLRGKDFELIPERLWKALSQWYGGSPPLPRQVIRNARGVVELELHPLTVKLFKHQSVSRAAATVAHVPAVVGGYSAAAIHAGAVTNAAAAAAYPAMPTTMRRYHAYQGAFSRRTAVRQIADFLGQRLHTKAEDMRLWFFRDESSMRLLEDDSATLEAAGFRDEDGILVEIRSRDGTWPEEISSLCSSGASVDRRLSGGAFLSSNPVPGVTGLNNLGNTCYMNAALQCVSNTKILAQYFNSNCHLFEINRANPLGMKGHIAKRYGDLVRDMAESTRSIAPIKLRWTIGRYRPHFSGFQQQDAQELLAFLLDGLHEDLNRVTDKPYAELADSHGRPDTLVAAEAWENHVLRNKSIIVDLFHGQLKSKVTCKVCGHESVRFDPFTYLSLPLPMESSVHIEVIVIRQDGTTPIKYGLTLETETRSSSTNGAVRTHLGRLAKIHPQNLVLVDIVQSQLRVMPIEEQKLKSMNGSCVFAYEVFTTAATAASPASSPCPPPSSSPAPSPCPPSSSAARRPSPSMTTAATTTSPASEWRPAAHAHGHSEKCKNV